MPLIKSKSKFDKSTCSFEKEGMKCGTEILKGDDYLYDTDAKKGFCTKHPELNDKAQEPQRGGPGGFKGGAPALCRSPTEAMEAITLWHSTVVPMILDTLKNSVNEDFFSIARMYQEIFLGKFTPSQIAK